MKKLYISDLDGTLLSHNSILSDDSRQKINKIFALKIPFTIASARGHTTIKEILKDLPFTLPIISLNGASLCHYETGENWQTNYLPEFKKEAIFKFLKSQTTDFIISTQSKKENIQKCWFPTKRNSLMEFFYQDRKKNQDPRLRVFENTSEVNQENEKAISFTVMQRSEKTTAFLKYFHQSLNGLNIYPMGNNFGWEWITIQDELATKGIGIKKIAEYCKIPLKNVVTFGDNVNDIPMLKIAGWGCAMANADESIKKQAEEVIPPHYEDGVVNYILNDQKK